MHPHVRQGTCPLWLPTARLVMPDFSLWGHHCGLAGVGACQWMREGPHPLARAGQFGYWTPMSMASCTTAGAAPHPLPQALGGQMTQAPSPSTP